MARISQYIPMCLLAVLILIHNAVQGLKCYRCLESCNDPFTKAGVDIVECSTVCLKTKIGNMVVLVCSPIIIATTCNTFGESTTCACDSDLCNGVTEVAVTKATNKCNGVTKVTVSMTTMLLAVHVFTKLF